MKKFFTVFGIVWGAFLVIILFYAAGWACAWVAETYHPIAGLGAGLLLISCVISATYCATTR